tara:strand:- start:712 stop:1101 length:390 start_codon:yes stop_codon:yes gene_type:complete
MKYFTLVMAALTLAAPSFAQRSYKGARPESRIEAPSIKFDKKDKRQQRSAPREDLKKELETLRRELRLLKGQLSKRNMSNPQRQRPQRNHQRQRPQLRIRCFRTVTPTFARNGFGWNWNRRQGKHWVRR